MTKTSVYLTDEELAKLADLADREGLSQAEVIRRAIRQYEPRHRGDTGFAVIGSGEGPGDSVADASEEDLLTGFGS